MTRIASIIRILVLTALASGLALLGASTAWAMVHDGSSSSSALGMTTSKKGGTKPSVRIGSHPKAIAHSSTATFTFSSSHAKATYVCSLDKRAYAACRTPKTYQRLADGHHSFAVKASVGGLSSAPARYRWTIATASTVQINSHPDSPFTSPDAAFTFSSDHTGATFQCSLDGAAYTDCTSPKTYASLSYGSSHTFAVTASAAGLTSDPVTFDWTIETVGQAALADAATVGQTEQDLSRFFAQYNMTVSITNIRPSQYAQTWATWTPVGEGDLPALKAYGAALVDEWAKYPLSFVRVSRVSGIVLVDQLAISGTRRGAMPDSGGDVMFYDIGYGSGDYAREGIHHEFDHLLTYNLSGSWAPSDPTWLSLNPPGFSYGSGGASCYTPGSCPSGSHAVIGFASGYAVSALEEDKAEVFGYLMETNDYWLLKSWIASDSYLAAKVANYENFLCGLSAEMCGNYFDVINHR